jgi:hypothetical protein
VRGADAASGIAVEIFVEQHVVAEMGVVPVSRRVAVDGAPAVPILKRNF